MTISNFKEACKGLNTAERMVCSDLNHLLHDIKTTPERYDHPVQLIEDIEYVLQGILKLPRDSRYHTHWLGIKGCICPKMDNRDPLYFGGGKIVVSDCPWHWRNNGQ